ncbi:hypothetical protein J2S43_006808 [Catenuloplanes nepalensis]|uniref:Uncharacterized protein n=1 Tax=Catenuloplanes nepalensis TaxID=587533 RepID=A0ABT9N3Q4_9ACTN|nr:hypothetical protein [Catenuloplanes nepalensis]MDP9798296.1 hypothetical protein [Catenuloplanes nepalensis]
MRRLFSTVLVSALIALTFGTPAHAAAEPAGSGWVRIPSPPYDYPAGLTCDFALHGDPIVDEVYYRTLTTKPDGTPRTEAAFGPLVFLVTNLSTGATTRGDASASGVITHHDDGALTYRVSGPLMVGFREGRGTLPRGFYVIDGPAWTLHISAGNYRSLSGAWRIRKDLCAALS